MVGSIGYLRLRVAGWEQCVKCTCAKRGKETRKLQVAVFVVPISEDFYQALLNLAIRKSNLYKRQQQAMSQIGFPGKGTELLGGKAFGGIELRKDCVLIERESRICGTAALPTD
jgi:hypothetical protein